MVGPCYGTRLLRGGQETWKGHRKDNMDMGRTPERACATLKNKMDLCYAKAILSTGIGVDLSEARINGQTMSPVRTQFELRAAKRGLRPCLYTNWWRNVGTLKLVIIWVSSSHASSFSGFSLTSDTLFWGLLTLWGDSILTCYTNMPCTLHAVSCDCL